jgi:hypothetical protein
MVSKGCRRSPGRQQRITDLGHRPKIKHIAFQLITSEQGALIIRAPGRSPNVHAFNLQDLISQRVTVQVMSKSSITNVGDRESHETESY